MFDSPSSTHGTHLPMRAQQLRTRATPMASKQARAPAQDAQDGVLQEVTGILAADPPTWPWILFAFAILGVGTALSYLLWRLVKPADFTPASDYAVFIGLSVMALAIERVLEPFSGLFIPSTKAKKARCDATAAQVRRFQAAMTTSQPAHAAKVQAARAHQAAAVAQAELRRSQSGRAVLMWATASVLAMLVCACLGVFLLRSVDTSSSPERSGSTTSATSAIAVSPTSNPAKDPNRLLDLVVTGLVVGAGTKPLHDMISQIQSASGKSRAS